MRSIMILGFDPGRDKCGIAVMGLDRYVHHHQVVLAAAAIATIQTLCQKYAVTLLVMGNQTTSKQWQQKISQALLEPLTIVMVDERNTSLEARDRYWEMYPPTGLSRLIPAGMRQPPRAIDDIVAILLIERYLDMGNGEVKS